jgi:hypothetical protein
MRRNNPAVFECPKSRNTLHNWRRYRDGSAICVSCYLRLSCEDAADCFRDTERASAGRE